MNKSKPYTGFFITIEGGDGSGKTTLSQLLFNELEKEGYGVVKTREPGGSLLSEHIRKVLLDPRGEFTISTKTELLLYLAARAENLESCIMPALRQGAIVICERFNDSTIAYQGCARELGMHFVEEMCHHIAEDPEITFLLDLDPAEGMRRVKALRREPLDRLEQEELQFHQNVRQGYLHLADQYRDRIILLDATLPIEELFHEAWSRLRPRLPVHK